MKEYKCECCSKLWPSPYGLRRHLNTKLIQGIPPTKKSKKTYRCEICNREFKDKYNQITHFKGFPMEHKEELIGLGLDPEEILASRKRKPYVKKMNKNKKGAAPL